MASAPTKIDPIRDRYFRPLEVAESTTDTLFYIAALLSFTVLLVNKNEYQTAYSIVQIAFVLSVIVVFFLGLGIRLYWTPRAEDQRRLDLLSNAHGVPLTHEQTTGYYNNDQTDPIKRLGVAVMENSHFSRAIALEMAKTERLKVLIYLAAFVIVLLYRNTELAVAATAAQAIFSEQILSRWFRLEWLRIRCDDTYKHLYSVFQASPNRSTMNARVLEFAMFYETGKANAGIMLSAKVFQKLNPSLSMEWDRIKATLKI
ncbi:hypothetical protein [Methylotetracoccus oryzae]|uniref:hypothetical protein n=1 Tax=Methylotetracoccus oryzae TaxID=1919059 RepID=UPI001118145B|nr:hypothetical protein [Methylotetracoccus oryzae]